MQKSGILKGRGEYIMNRWIWGPMIMQGKLVIRAWQPIGILESVYMGGAKGKFDIVALRWWITWRFEMVSTAFCILLDLSINLPIVNGCYLVIVWLFGTLWCWECTDLMVCCFAWLQRNTKRRSSIARSKSRVSQLGIERPFWYC